jgi:type I restriction enzyme S subunit
MIVSTGFLTLTAKSGFDPHYLACYFKSPIFNLSKDKNCTGATQKAINNNSFKNLKIPYYSLPKQREIAKKLEHIDSLLTQRQESIRLLDDYLRSVFLEMFGDPVKNERGWDVVKIGNATDFITSGSRGWAKYYSNIGDVFLRIQNVGYNLLKTDELSFVNAPISAEAKRTMVKENDIILSITADLGRTAVIPKDFPKAYINQHLSIIRLKDEFNPLFVSEYFAFQRGKSQFKKLTKGGVKAGLNFDDIKSLFFINPPSYLQNIYLETKKRITKQQDVCKNQLDFTHTLFNALSQEYFG